ncbi:MAG: helix-turn-helix transcriptional regulator [Pseudomonadota bacterium]
MASKLVEIGERLRAYRMGAGLSADALGQRLNMSRASVYRLESSGIGKIDTLSRVAKLLGIPVETLLGVGMEYVPSAIAYFERLRQIEAQAEHIFVAFGPIVYLLTSDEYDASLREALLAQAHAATRPARHTTNVDDLLGILAARKAQYRARQPAITNVLSLPELVRFGERGLAGDEATPAALRAHRAMVRDELERIAGMLEQPPIGVQIGILFDELPTTSFSVIRQARGSFALTSPFRIGPRLNIWRGVGMISQDAESLRLHSLLARELWSEVVTGQKAADFIRRRISIEPAPQAGSGFTAGLQPAAA